MKELTAEVLQAVDVFVLGYFLALNTLYLSFFSIALVILAPFYFVLINSVKSFAAILTETAAWPREFVWDNYLRAWDVMNYPVAFMNSLIITVAAITGIVIFTLRGA